MQPGEESADDADDEEEEHVYENPSDVNASQYPDTNKTTSPDDK